MGIEDGYSYQPAAVFGTSSQQPLWSSSQNYPHPSGSVWLKVGSVGNGLNPIVSEYDDNVAAFIARSVNLAQTEWGLLASLDSTGGQSIPEGTLYAQYGFNGEFSRGPVYFYKRVATGPTVVTGSQTSISLSGGPYFARVQVSIPGSANLSAVYSLSLSGGSSVSQLISAWVSAAIPYTTITQLDTGALQITHTEGGVILIDDTAISGSNKGASTGLLTAIGMGIGSSENVVYGPSTEVSYTPSQASTSGVGIDVEINVSREYGAYTVLPTTFVDNGSGYVIGDTVTFSGADLGGTSPFNDLVVKVTATGVGGAVQGITYVSGIAPTQWKAQLTNFAYLEFTANEGAPVSNPDNNTNWYYAVVDEADIMINTTDGWKGYRNVAFDDNGFPLPYGSGTPDTDPNGPIVSASEPTEQSDGTALVYGDLWIDTSDLENYPIISRYQNVGGEDQWVLIDTSDQTSSNGIVFADARWSSNQNTINPVDDPIPTIQSLLVSDNLDLDAPESSLYPVGMMLFNTRRSGYNVKQYRTNYFNSLSFPDEILPTIKSTWVSASGLAPNGAAYMGRKAQRNMVVEAMRSTIDTNLSIRDEDNFFNLMAAPFYPELQTNMNVLNGDRGETAYILGDTPIDLPESATDIQAWATSVPAEGGPARNTYLGLFYPSGLANDLSGNTVAVPASHAMLRTFLRNDTIAYPWLAAAGTRRGLIDNLLGIGYVDRATGEFVNIKTRLGIRDVLYTNFINPLVFFTGNGLLNYGNKNSFTQSGVDGASALDRINVARLVAYIRRQLTVAARPFVFEPNDATTRKEISGVVESLMLDLVAKRGLYDYLVVCDESNNTPARIDRNELWIDVAIEPVKAAEFIYIPVRILNTGELSA
jgi:hypothetical protein